MMFDPKALNLPWTTETDLPYGEQPRIYDATGALVAVVGNAEIDKQDDWEQSATAIVCAVNALFTVTPAEVGGMVERLDHSAAFAFPVVQEAASALQTLSARNAALEAEIERLRDKVSALSAPKGGQTEDERIRKEMDRILKKQSEYNNPFAPKGGPDHG